MTTKTTKFIPVEEAINPREKRLERVAWLLRAGALVNAALGIALVIGAFAIVATGQQTLFSVLHSVTLFNYGGADDTALAILFLALLVNVAMLLVAMVGTLAREVWTFVVLAATAIANLYMLVVYGFTPGILTGAIVIAALVWLLRDPRAFRTNPVMTKELRGRMRGVRAFMVITIYLGLMSAFAVVVYLVQSSANQFSGTSAGGLIGRVLFAATVGAQLLLIIFIAPSFTSGAITGERERKTFELLQTTLLDSPSFVIGKLEAALSYVLLLLFSAVPLQSIAFLFGGVSELEVGLAFVILAVTAIGLGTVGLYFSTSVERSLTASVRAYGVALVLVFGVAVVLVMLNAFSSGLFNSGNALPATFEIPWRYFNDLLISLNPIATAFVTQDLLINQNQLTFGTVTLTSGSTIPTVSPWITFTIIYLVASAVLIVLSVRKMRMLEN
jgi:ABC-2 type transport system permease protein